MGIYYFFGCSLTAGDELADSYFCPNIDIKTMQVADYYRFRKELWSTVNYHVYTEKNKEFAYPAILARDMNIAVNNMALNSIGLRENIVKIIKLVLEQPHSIKHIFIQIPPSTREAVLNRNGVYSMQMTNPYRTTVDNFTDYIKIKALTHDIVHYSAEDFNDMLLVDGFLKHHSVPHTFIEINNNVINKSRDLENTYFQYLDQHVKQLNWIQFYPTEDLLTVTKHLTEPGHKIMADKIKNEIFK